MNAQSHPITAWDTPSSRMASVIDDIAAETPARAWLRQVGPIARQLNAESLSDNLGATV